MTSEAAGGVLLFVSRTSCSAGAQTITGPTGVGMVVTVVVLLAEARDPSRMGRTVGTAEDDVE